MNEWWKSPPGRRPCNNSLHCSSPLRDFLDVHREYSLLSYWTSNFVPLEPPADKQLAEDKYRYEPSNAHLPWAVRHIYKRQWHDHRAPVIAKWSDSNHNHNHCTPHTPSHTCTILPCPTIHSPIPPLLDPPTAAVVRCRIFQPAYTTQFLTHGGNGIRPSWGDGENEWLHAVHFHRYPHPNPTEFWDKEAARDSGVSDIMEAEQWPVGTSQVLLDGVARFKEVRKQRVKSESKGG